MNLAADADIFFADFGESALIGLDPVTVIFTDPSRNLQIYDQEINSSAPSCVMKDADVEALMLENGTLITIRGADYEVINVAPDGAGLSIVTLTKA